MNENIIEKFKKEDYDGIIIICSASSGASIKITKFINEEFPDFGSIIREKCYVLKYNILGSSLIYNTEYGDIICCFAKFYHKAPSNNIDSFDCRISYLKECLTDINYNYRGKKLLISNIFCGKSKPKEYIKQSNDIFFKEQITPILESILKDVVYDVHLRDSIS